MRAPGLTSAPTELSSSLEHRDLMCFCHFSYTNQATDQRSASQPNWDEIRLKHSLGTIKLSITTHNNTIKLICKTRNTNIVPVKLTVIKLRWDMYTHWHGETHTVQQGSSTKSLVYFNTSLHIIITASCVFTRNSWTANSQCWVGRCNEIILVL